MPGTITMEQQGAIGSLDLKKDRSHAQIENTSQVPVQAQSHAPSHVNGPVQHGPNGVLPNGVLDAHHEPPTTNGEPNSMSVTMTGPENPPQLDQSWREHPSNKSLGLMIERVSQQCYYDLNQTVIGMSEIPVEPQHQQVNGIVPQGAQDTSEGSLRKKRLLLDFANTQRDRFIKALVLSEWCRNEKDQGKLIDVKVWQDKQRMSYVEAARAIGQTKVNMIPAKMPNPNIEGAMELLATGSASWVPDLGYIPPKRLSAKQLLKTLRNMNVTLATRLNLHEELPPYFQDFTIADGRATFTVQDEFEVDLSVADEDPTTPFYFIDIRLLFAPAPSTLDDRLRHHLENKVNYELAHNGLKGCYGFLHSFVLTHKINVLRSQAAELVRSKWFGCIRMENMRRSLAVQYWTGVPGPKSWIEIGISSGKQKESRSRRPPNPQISVRWFRKGIEIKDEALQFDWKDLDLEKCLSAVIARHTSWIMADLLTRIRSLISTKSLLVAEMKDAKSKSESSALSLSLPSMRESLRVQVESVTGQLSISPPSPASAHVENRLNRDVKADASKLLPDLVCSLVQEQARRTAELLEWTLVPNLLYQDNLQKVFGQPVQRFSIYSPGRHWGSETALAVTFSIAGEKWWAVSLVEKSDEQRNVNGRIIASAREVSVSAPADGELAMSQDRLVRIEKLVVAEVALGALSRQLTSMGVPYKLDESSAAANMSSTFGKASRPQAMFIRFAPLMQDTKRKGSGSWANDLVRLTHHGVAETAGGTTNVRHDLRLTVEEGKMKHLHKHLTQSWDRNLALNGSGGLALRFSTPFGQPFAEQIKKRLQSVQRLDHYLANLEKHQFKCMHVNLSRLSFTYSKAPELSAELAFSNDGGLPVRLKLLPPDSNPHLRVRSLLEQEMNRTGDAGVEAFTNILEVTLPLLQTLDRLEKVNSAKQAFTVHPRSSTWYILKYRAPLPGCSFSIRAKSKTEGQKTILKWHIQEMRGPNNSSGWPDDLIQALKELWRSKGEKWDGLGSADGNGIIADSQGIGPAVEKLDEVVRRFETSVEASAAASGNAQGQAQEQPKDKSQASSQSQSKSETAAPTQQLKQASGPAAAPKKNDPDVIMLD